MLTLTPSRTPNDAQRAQIARKYGMFIHFGINTFYDTEWSNGKLDVSGYRPSKIDADSWVKNARDAGMQYVIITAKHHDGFCLWHTEQTDYGVLQSPNPTDVVACVAKACEKYGISLGIYYSLWDRHETCYKNDEAYVDYMCRQLTELLDGRYGKVVEVWFDGGWDKRPKRWNIPKLYDLVHRLQPDCVCSVNQTIGRHWQKLHRPRFQPDRQQQGDPMHYFPCDFRLWDPHFTRADDPKLFCHKGQTYYLPFEATICIRNMTNWFWDPKYTSDPLVPLDFMEEKYRLMTDHDNVLVVNVSPNTDGVQEEADIRHLLEFAKRMGLRN